MRESKLIKDLRSAQNLKGKTLITAAKNEFLVIRDEQTEGFIKVKCTHVDGNSAAFLQLNQVLTFGDEVFAAIKEEEA